MPEQHHAGEVGLASGGSPEDPRIDRRRFLQGAAGGLATLALAACGSDASTGAPKRHDDRLRPAWALGSDPPPAVSPTVLASGVIVPTARWLIEENAKPGTSDWVVTGMQTAHGLEGYASQVSVAPGDQLTLFVNTTAKSVQMQAYRMGYYQGLGARLIFQTDSVAAGPQVPYSLAPGVNTVSCRWNPTFTLNVDASWPPGNYLLKLVGNGGQQQYIPLTVRDDTSTAAFVIQNSVTTWQAYNLWGGYSLYYGRTAGGGKDYAHRARAVSYDRPYPQSWAQGASDFVGNEFPLLYHLESLGLDLTYWTDVDLHARPQLLANHRCLFSLGHDEYWSAPMRAGAAAALAQGTNLVFLGANASYRQIRLQPSPVGPDRLQVCYKSAAEDPVAKTDPALTTVNWNQPPVNQPESALIGSTYQSVGAKDDLVITDPSSWLWSGCGLSPGQRLPQVIIGEYDRFVPTAASPKNVDVLAHSPIAGQHNWSDITYYSAGPGAGGVLATGNAHFIFMLSNTTGFPNNVVPKATPGVTDVLLRAMENIYDKFGNGPASVTEPSTGNWPSVYQGSSATKTPGGTNVA
jgi:hypothetical protein